MTIHRRNPRRDRNEPEIMAELRAYGFQVEQVSGTGVPDLLLSRAGRWYTAEIKSEGEKLTEAQRAFHARAKAHIPVLRTAEDVGEWVEFLRGRP